MKEPVAMIDILTFSVLFCYQARSNCNTAQFRLTIVAIIRLESYTCLPSLWIYTPRSSGVHALGDSCNQAAAITRENFVPW